MINITETKIETICAVGIVISIVICVGIMVI